MTIIELDHLTKTFRSPVKQTGLAEGFRNLFRRKYKTTEAVRDLSFTIEEGEFIGFLGPNGAGKTTALKMMSGVLYPSGGGVKVLGFTPWERKRAFQKSIGLVLGIKNQLWWDLPAEETFLLNKAIYDIADAPYHESVTELVELLNLKHVLRTQVRRLSLGERMKCELVAALLHRPRVLFLDEPTIGLDVISQDNLRRFLREYNRRHRTTILMSSHNMRDVEALARRVIVINHGQLVYDGALERLVSESSEIKRLTLTFHEPVAIDRLRVLGRVIEHQEQRAVLEVPRAQAQTVVGALLKDLPVADLNISDIALEEIIARLFRAS